MAKTKKVQYVVAREKNGSWEGIVCEKEDSKTSIVSVKKKLQPAKTLKGILRQTKIETYEVSR